MKMCSLSLWVSKSSHNFIFHKRVILCITNVSFPLLSRNTTFFSMVFKEGCLNKKSNPHCFIVIMKRETYNSLQVFLFILMLFLPLLRWESKKGLSFKSSREAVAGRFPTLHLSRVSSFCCKAGPATVEGSKPFPTQTESNLM